MSFDGDKYWQLKADDAKVDYAAPQWIDNNGNGNAADPGEHNYAVAFTRNTNPKIGAKFNITGAGNLGAITIRATGPDGIAIPETAAQVNGDTVWIDPTPSSTLLPNTVKFYDKNKDTTAFKLDWELQIGSSGWIKAATTKHTVYVTQADPKTKYRQETIFEIGCRTANNQSEAYQITENIWAEFAGLKMVRVMDGAPLTYYKAYAPKTADGAPVLGVEGLLATTDGRCGSWAELFASVRLAQGLRYNYKHDIWYKNVLNPPPLTVDERSGNSFYYYFITKAWSFLGGGSSGVSEFPFLNTVSASEFDNFPAYNSYPWTYAEVKYLGRSAQGNSNPAAMFTDHAQVMIDGVIYDPSYGRKYYTLEEFESDSVDGYIRARESADHNSIRYEVKKNDNNHNMVVQDLSEY